MRKVEQYFAPTLRKGIERGICSDFLSSKRRGKLSGKLRCASWQCRGQADVPGLAPEVATTPVGETRGKES
jgi:hypothetical protein